MLSRIEIKSIVDRAVLHEYPNVLQRLHIGKF
nr:MAG TPA: hypothetical protein [Caudoviricetes sp.]